LFGLERKDKMLFEMDKQSKGFKPISGMSIMASLGESEKDLENYLKEIIGDILFPEYMVFGNERVRQREADLFAVNSNGDLVVFELKVHGHRDRGKVYQALSYAQSFAYWRYSEMNNHFKKCFHEDKELIDAFEEHYGYKIDLTEFNKKQKIIVISHSSSEDTGAITKYWKKSGVDIEEYFYRFYEVAGERYFELSNELFFQQNSYNCWINTCKTHYPEAYLDMVKHKKAATYGNRRSIIGEWMNRSYIFLYHNGYGIIGAGKGTAKIEDSSNKELKEEERSIELSNFVSGVNIDNGTILHSLEPSTIKGLLQRDFFFSQTIVTMPEDEAKKLFEECQKTFK
jgi:hypothetical protein